MTSFIENAINMLASLPCWLWRLRGDKRFWIATAISTVMWGLGWYLVHIWVSRVGTEAVLVRNIVSVIMVYPTYRIHKWLWRDRLNKPRKKLGFRWSKTTLQLHAANTAVYLLAVHAAGMPYMKTGLALSVPFALLGFWRRD